MTTPSPAAVDGRRVTETADGDELAAAPDRRTNAVLAAIDRGAAQARAVLLTGPGVGDLLILPMRQVVNLRIALADYATRRGLGMVVFHPANGVDALPTLPDRRAPSVDPGVPTAHPADVLMGLLSQVTGHVEPVLLVIDHADLVLAASAGLDLALASAAIRDVAADPAFHSAGHRLVLVDRGGGVSPLVEHDLSVVRVLVGLPDVKERILYFRKAVAAVRSAPLILDPDLDPDEAGRLAGGLALITAQQARRVSTVTEPVSRRTIAEIKGEAVRSAAQGALEVVPVERSFDDVAGLPQIRLALADVKAAGTNIIRWCLNGPPGAGKSLVAQAIAAELGVTLVTYGQIFDQWLGNSERNVKRAHEVLRQMSPILLYIDEADTKGLGRRGQASVHQAYDNALGEWLATFGDSGANDTGLSFLLATNRVGSLDTAVLSRCSKVIPVLYPDAAEAAQIFLLQATRAHVPIAVDADELADLIAAQLSRVQALSGRTLVARVDDASSVARRAGSELVRSEHVLEAFEDGFSSDWNPVDEHATLAAIAAASTRRVLPWEAAKELGESGLALPSYLSPFTGPDDRLVMERVRARVDQLAGNSGAG
jgi:ATPase family associated with various cellular activities (AAA)